MKTPKLEDVANTDAIIEHADGACRLVQAKAPDPRRRRARVKVGGVYVTGDKATATQVEQAVAKSTEILERLSLKIVRPGVRLKAARNIPLFFADPERPDRFLRKLNGKVERGVLENGAFKVVD